MHIRKRKKKRRDNIQPYKSMVPISNTLQDPFEAKNYDAHSFFGIMEAMIQSVRFPNWEMEIPNQQIFAGIP